MENCSWTMLVECFTEAQHFSLVSDYFLECYYMELSKNVGEFNMTGITTVPNVSWWLTPKEILQHHLL
jgi:hypothetical protein